MLAGRITQISLRALDWLAVRIQARRNGVAGSRAAGSREATTHRSDETPEHLATGRRGEEDAYFYLRRRGYTIIARNYRSANHRGELDLVGWEGDVLCFIEVKTRTSRDVKPAQTAVDREKQNDLRLVAHDFLRQMPRALGARPSASFHVPERGGVKPESTIGRTVVPWRFDVLAVYYDCGQRLPSFELFQNAFPVAYNRSLARSR